jgi:citrate synthase
MNLTPGLEGVVAAETRLSDVDGERGRLVISGFLVERLAAEATFEDAVGLLWDGQRPDAAGRERVRAALSEGRVAAFERLRALGDSLQQPDGMDALRTAVSHLSGVPPLGLVGAVGTLMAAWLRTRAGQPPRAPRPEANHAADVLRMALGAEPSAAAARGLDTYLVTVCDHGMNASTFAARVVASTGSDDVSAVVAAIGALKGPLHGGAPGPVLDMLDAVAAPANAEAWLEAELLAGRRIMGMGTASTEPATRGPRSSSARWNGSRRTGSGSAGCRSPGRWSARRRARCAPVTPIGRCTPTWSSTRRSCSTRWACRGPPSPRPSLRPGSRVGWRT